MEDRDPGSVGEVGMATSGTTKVLDTKPNQGLPGARTPFFVPQKGRRYGPRADHASRRIRRFFLSVSADIFVRRRPCPGPVYHSS